MQCDKCKKLENGSLLKYRGKAYCRACAHNLTHMSDLKDGHIAIPVTDGETGELIPFGTYPNIDWS